VCDEKRFVAEILHFVDNVSSLQQQRCPTTFIATSAEAAFMKQMPQFHDFL